MMSRIAYSNSAIKRGEQVEKELLIYIDGQFYPKSAAKVSVYDHGLLYGDGVFEGIRAYDGVVFKLKEHIDRLYRSAHVIMLQIPLSKEEMIKAVLDTLKKNQLKNSYICLLYTSPSPRDRQKSRMPSSA